MKFYIWLISIPLFLLFFQDLIDGSKLKIRNSNKKRGVCWLVLFMAILMFLSTFRGKNIGADYENYIEVFNRIGRSGTAYMEKGYVILNRFAHLLGDKPYHLSLVINLIFFPILTIYIYKYVDRKYWLLILFIFVADPYFYIQSTFNMVRQATGTAFILLAVIFLLSDKKKFALAAYVVAVSIHNSMAAMLILPIILWIKWNKKTFRAMSIICFFLNVFNVGDLMAVGLRIFDYGNYEKYEASLLNNIAYVILVFVVIQIIILFYDEICETKLHRRFVNLYIFALCFLMLAVENDETYRLYVSIAYIALPAVPIIIEGMRKYKYGNLVKWGYIGYYTAFYIGYIYMLYQNQNPEYIPFKLIF